MFKVEPGAARNSFASADAPPILSSANKSVMAKAPELKLKEGDKAPAFTVATNGGGSASLADYEGKHVVLYFYPKDDTPGCTKEACAFRDQWSKFELSGTVVVGVSRDSVEKHREFASEHKLQFPLLSDDDGSICKSYGVGTTFGMASRVTFVIDRSGTVARTFADVSPATHAEEVLQAVAALPK